MIMVVYKLYKAINEGPEYYDDPQEAVNEVVRTLEIVGEMTQSEIEVADAEWKMRGDDPDTVMRKGIMLLVRHSDGRPATPFACLEHMDLEQFTERSPRRPDRVEDPHTGRSCETKHLH
jgi:hypothetical protein